VFIRCKISSFTSKQSGPRRAAQSDDILKGLGIARHVRHVRHVRHCPTCSTLLDTFDIARHCSTRSTSSTLLDIGSNPSRIFLKKDLLSKFPYTPDDILCQCARGPEQSDTRLKLHVDILIRLFTAFSSTPQNLSYRRRHEFWSWVWILNTNSPTGSRFLKGREMV
jgi:hypothetical protein